MPGNEGNVREWSDRESKEHNVGSQRSAAHRRIIQGLVCVSLAAIIIALVSIRLHGMMALSVTDQSMREGMSYSRNLNTATELTEQVIQWSYDVAVMGQILYDDDPTLAIPKATVYTDEPDRALSVKSDDGTCIAVFRGTTAQVADWLQNNPLGDPASFQSPLGTNCTSYGGYHSAYFDTNFLEDLRTDIRNCVSSCTDGDCDLVIAGASQGAAIAAIAAVDMEDLIPFLITFGQPATLISGPCEAIDIGRYFRFTNTEQLPGYIQEGPFLYYDLVPSFSLPNRTDWIGNMFVISENKGGVVVFPNEFRPEIGPSLWSKSAHLLDSYIPRLEALKDGGVFPIPTDGWVDGSLCNFDIECQSGLCNDYNCTAAGSDGAACSDNSNCMSGRCDGILNGVCKPQLDIGAWCTENSDCLSGKCLGKCVDGSTGILPCPSRWIFLVPTLLLVWCWF